MYRRLTSIIILALVVATAASYLVYRLVQTRMASSDAGASNRIVVAARDLQTGVLVHEVDLNYANWVGPVPKGFVLTQKDVVGRGVVSPIYQGEPVTENRLALPGAGGGLAATIPDGMRACAVKVNDVVGVAGFVVPGMRVDVLISATAPSSPGGGPRVKTILQNVVVLSAGQNYQKDAEGKPVEVQVVNLLVTPEQAEILSLASNETRIQLVLRNPLDNQTTKTSGIAMADLFGESPAPPKPAVVKVAVAVHAAIPQPKAVPPPPPVLQTRVVEVLNGSKKTEASFTKSEENR